MHQSMSSASRWSDHQSRFLEPSTKACFDNFSTGRYQLSMLNYEPQQLMHTSTFIQRVALVPIIVAIVAMKNMICGTIPFAKSKLKIDSLYSLSKQQMSPVYTSCTLIVKYT